MNSKTILVTLVALLGAGCSLSYHAQNVETVRAMLARGCVPGEDCSARVRAAQDLLRECRQLGDSSCEYEAKLLQRAELQARARGGQPREALPPEAHPETQPILPRQNSDLVVALEGTSVVATLTVRMQCRNSGAEPWHPCGTKPAPGKRLAGKLLGGSVFQSTTDADGRATFDLGSVEPNDAILAGHKFEVAVVPANAFDLAVNQLDLGGTPLFESWGNAVDAAETKKALALLDQIERELATVKPPWTEKQVAAFSHVGELIDAMGSIKRQHPRVQFAPADVDRVGKISKRVGVLAPGYDKALDALHARRAKDALKIGRAYILQNLAAPSTARFVNDVVMLDCPKGVVTAHEFDAQNRLGAVLRQSWWVIQDERTDRIFHDVCSGGPSEAIHPYCAMLYLHRNDPHEQQCKAYFH